VALIRQHPLKPRLYDPYMHCALNQGPPHYFKACLIGHGCYNISTHSPGQHKEGRSLDVISCYGMHHCVHIVLTPCRKYKDVDLLVNNHQAAGGVVCYVGCVLLNTLLDAALTGPERGGWAYLHVGHRKDIVD